MSNWTIREIKKTYLINNWEAVGFENPTAIQEKAIPLILDGKDCIAESPTGTGKTLAYVLPVLEKLDDSLKGIQVLILVPSRELAMQILDEVRKFTKNTDIKSASFIGGANIKKQLEKLKEHPQIVIGTPGRIQELIKMKKMKMHQVKTVIVDEADQLVSREHVNTVGNVIKSTLKERQLLFFSATITKDTEIVGRELMKEPEMIRVKREQTQTNIEHFYITCEQRDKVDMLRKMMHTGLGRTLVFLKNIERVEEAESKLKFHGLELAVLAGEGKKMERKQSLVDFRSGKIPLLITTDVAARGLDVEDVETVIHFDFPSTSTQYTHRSGRTGRMGKKGTIISIVNPQEESFLKKMGKELNISFVQKLLKRGQLFDVRMSNSSKR